MILVAIAIVIKSCYVNFFRCRSYNGITIGVLIYSVRSHVILTVCHVGHQFTQRQIVVLALYALLQRRVNKYKEVIHGFLGIPV